MIASLFFYSWGNLCNLFFLVGFILLNYFLAMLVKENGNCLALGIVCDAAFLVLFKYFNLGISFPAGISFYTFHGISCLVDIKRGDAEPEKNIFKFALYLSFFPKLIMGPIVKYKDIYKTIADLTPSFKQISDGLLKFTVGLGKKEILSLALAGISSECWADASLSAASAWLGLIAFSLELYYDFSGYSDMAAGLSEMIGINIGDNFIYPYESSSLSEFWQRWHVSLGLWFRDYIYFPLGGSRNGKVRMLLNILIVWLISGLWHGTGLNFVCWALFLYAFILIEKLCPLFEHIPKACGIIFADAAVVLGWVFFNSENTLDALLYFSYLFGGAESAVSSIAELQFGDNLPLLFVAAVGCTSLPKTFALQLFGYRDKPEAVVTTVFKCIFVLMLLSASTLYMVRAGYTPFIYQSF